MRAAHERSGELACSAAARVLCLFLAGLCGCTADVEVYRAATEAQDAGAPPADAGKAPTPMADGGTAVFGCRSASNGGSAILNEILARLNDDFLTREKPACTSDADCSQTFVTPTCNESSGTCMPCPDPAQQVAFGVVLGACLTSAAMRCCRDPEAATDCIVRACAIGCGGK